MSRESNRFAIGLFVLGALALFVGSVTVLGSGLLFRETQRYVTFFDGSVKGLRAGAPVLFRGVHIGEVKQVVLQIDHRQEQVRIPVIFEIYPGSLMEQGDRPKEENAVISRMIEQGLKTRLEIQSIVTGALALNLDFHPNVQAKFVCEIPGLLEIPSTASAIDILGDALGDIPIQEIVTDVQNAIKQVSKLLESEDLQQLSGNLTMTMEDIRSTSKSVRDILENSGEKIGPLTTELQTVLRTADTSIKEFSKIADRVNSLLSDDSPDRYQISQLLKDSRDAARHIKALAEYLERNPDSLLRGK